MNRDEILTTLREGDEGVMMTPQAEKRVLSLDLFRYLDRVDCCGVVCDGAAMFEQHETGPEREVRILLVKSNGDAFVSHFVKGARVHHQDIPEDAS